MSFSVVINSANNYSGVTAGNNKQSLQFAINWSFLPEGQYKLGYDFISRPTTANDIYYLQIPDLGCDFHSYTASSTSSCNSNKYLGTISQWFGAATTASCLFSQYLNSPPLYLSSKPSNDIFTINILNYDGVSAFTNAGSWANFDYTLILYFEKIND